jgi:methyl-accepting chemotaxis protein
MLWSNLSIAKKIGIGIGSTIVLLGIICFLSYSGVSKLVISAQEVIHGNKLNGLIAQKEIDHLNWTNKLTTIFTDKTVTDLDVQLNDHLCAFGVWLYGSQRIETVKLIPELAPLLNAIEAPHASLHESARQIQQTLKFKTPRHFETTEEQVAASERKPNNNLTAMPKAAQIYSDKTLPALRKVQTLLGDIRQTARENIMTDTQMLNGAIKMKLQILIASIVSLIVGFILSMFIAKSISGPMVRGIAFAEKIADGDLSRKLDINQADEVGILSNSLNKMVENLRLMFTDISTGTKTLTTSSTELSAISEQMASGSEQTSDRASSVSTAAKGMATSMNHVASATDQATNNLQIIVTAAEEMSFTINEISENVAKGGVKTLEAVSQAEHTSRKINGLKEAASEISKVIETITEISDQTNLLALNATIEAARSGEAGQGFAVVAREIKDLAQQTAEANETISSKINNVQTSTGETITAIQSIVKIINEINIIVTAVETSMAEQSATTQQISNNVSQAAAGIKAVSENINLAASVAGDVTEDIHDVSQSSEELKAGSLQVNSSAIQLSKLAESLNAMVNKFALN